MSAALGALPMITSTLGGLGNLAGGIASIFNPEVGDKISKVSGLVSNFGNGMMGGGMGGAGAGAAAGGMGGAGGAGDAGAAAGGMADASGAAASAQDIMNAMKMRQGLGGTA